MVVLDGGLRMLQKNEGGLEEILALIIANDESSVALNFPGQLNQGMAKTSLSKYTGRGRPQLHLQNMRLCELMLYRLGLRGWATPAELEQCPPWMRQGFIFYERLEAAGLNLFSTENEGASRYLETQAEAGFRALLGSPLLNQHTLEGRIQRQLILYEQGLRIADPMDFFEEVTRHRLMQGSLPLQKLYLLTELDAMAAAYTAWLAVNHPEKTSQVGDPMEGTLILPQLKELENSAALDARQMTIVS